MRFLAPLVGLAIIGIGTTQALATPPTEPEDIVNQFGGSIIRGVDMDICFPATSEEYKALGKNAIVLLSTWTAIGTELPLKSAYLQVHDVRVPLQRLAVLPKHAEERGGESYERQDSFYLVPISLLKKDGELAVDFTGDRTAFGVSTYSKGDLLRGAPSFLRLDDYDAPSDPDMAAVATVLRREYPDRFGNAPE